MATPVGSERAPLIERRSIDTFRNRSGTASSTASSRCGWAPTCRSRPSSPAPWRWCWAATCSGRWWACWWPAVRRRHHGAARRAGAATGPAADDFQPGAVRRLRRGDSHRAGLRHVPGLHRHRHRAVRPGHRPAAGRERQRRHPDVRRRHRAGHRVRLPRHPHHRPGGDAAGHRRLRLPVQPRMALADVGELLANRHFTWGSFLV